jgi:hypothetical protein
MNPLFLGAALGRTVRIKCSHCGRTKLVTRRDVETRLCPHCHRRFPNPPEARPKR